MHVPTWIWLVTIAATIGIFVFDFYAHVKTPHEPTLKESGIWSLVYIGLAIVFGLGMWLVWGSAHGAEFFAGYITEKSLSVDNLFIFLIIMSRFAVPRIYQQKVLLIGIAVALVLRGVFIAVGASVIANFSWIFYVFGVFLIWTAISLAREDHSTDAEYKENRAMRLLRRFTNATDDYHGDKMFARIDGKRLITPMFLVIVAIGSTDLLFALDSIPAIFGLTKEPYIVFTANALALMGLRQLYFLLGGLLERLIYLSKGLSVILLFIGVKMIVEELANNSLSFINGGQPIPGIPHIPIWLSLSVILGVLVVTAALSLIVTSRAEATRPEKDAQ